MGMHECPSTREMQAKAFLKKVLVGSTPSAPLVFISCLVQRSDWVSRRGTPAATSGPLRRPRVFSTTDATPTHFPTPKGIAFPVRRQRTGHSYTTSHHLPPPTSHPPSHPTVHEAPGDFL